jgi:hypothetical protein
MSEKPKPEWTPTRPIVTAIEASHPIYWLYFHTGRQFVLRATTYTFENGRYYSRKLYATYSGAQAYRVHQYLLSYPNYNQTTWSQAKNEYWLDTGIVIGKETTESKS